MENNVNISMETVAVIQPIYLLTLFFLNENSKQQKRHTL